MTAITPSPSYLSGSLYFVRSDRNPALFYTVAAVDGRCACSQRIVGLLHCQCPDHVHRARDCKHVHQVIAGQVVPATPKAMPAPVPRPSFDVDDLYSDAGAALRRSVAAVRAVAS